MFDLILLSPTVPPGGGTRELHTNLPRKETKTGFKLIYFKKAFFPLKQNIMFFPFAINWNVYDQNFARAAGQ